MPLIEVLPNSTSISAPGWAYVPDTGYDPSKAPIQPGARKRNARVLGPGGADTTARQNTAVLKRLADLDKDNFKDVQIAIPSKQKDSAGRGTSLRKTTPLCDIADRPFQFQRARPQHLERSSLPRRLLPTMLLTRRLWLRLNHMHRTHQSHGLQRLTNFEDHRQIRETPRSLGHRS